MSHQELAPWQTKDTLSAGLETPRSSLGQAGGGCEGERGLGFSSLAAAPAIFLIFLILKCLGD